MPRIARFNKDYYFNFDDNYLYTSDGKKVLESELDNTLKLVLEYLCENANCFLSKEQLKDGLARKKNDEAVYYSDTTIRGYIKRIRDKHFVYAECIGSKKGSGYIFIGSRIEKVVDSNGNDSNEKKSTISKIQSPGDFKEAIADFLKNESEIESDLLKAIMICSAKWGACTFDEIPQNTNTCEGAMALIASKYSERYMDAINDAIDYLSGELTEKGLKSKSLDEETVVPSSMFLYILKDYYKEPTELVNSIVSHLWEARSSNGWGIYVKKMNKDANIGCTYWALVGLSGYEGIDRGALQKYIKSLYKYEDTYAYGSTINVANPKIPYLYSTSMMYIIYNLLSKKSRDEIGNRYNPQKAIEFITNNFDNPFYLTEQEGINGVEVDGKITIHTVGWNHMTINYSLSAIAIAIENGYYNSVELIELLQRVENVVTDFSEMSEGRRYWTSPSLSLEKENRGKIIFPTMHALVGLSKIRNAIEKKYNKGR